MDKQEEIREWIAGLIISDCDNCEELDCGGANNPRCTMDYKQTDKILKYLHSQGVVIRGDGELPSIFDVNDNIISALEYKKKLEGYVAVEPLIKEP